MAVTDQENCSGSRLRNNRRGVDVLPTGERCFLLQLPTSAAASVLACSIGCALALLVGELPLHYSLLLHQPAALWLSS